MTAAVSFSRAPEKISQPDFFRPPCAVSFGECFTAHQPKKTMITSPSGANYRGQKVLSMVVSGSPKRWDRSIFHPPEGKDYKWYISGIFPANWGMDYATDPTF